MMRLGDDGTLDTVLVCSECGQETRYNYDPEGADPGLTPECAYDSFVAWAIEDAEQEHECESPACQRCQGKGRVWMGDLGGVYVHCPDCQETSR